MVAEGLILVLCLHGEALCWLRQLVGLWNAQWSGLPTPLHRRDEASWSWTGQAHPWIPQWQVQAPALTEVLGKLRVKCAGISPEYGSGVAPALLPGQAGT